MFIPTVEPALKAQARHWQGHGSIAGFERCGRHELDIPGGFVLRGPG